MSSEIYLTSDTHYCHDNILKFTDANGNLIRGSRFSSVDEMNECMFDNWNETVKQGDTVYHLGDVAFGNYTKDQKFIDTFRSLPGDKILIVGNHDTILWMVKENLFDDLQMWKKLKDQKMLLTHVPIHQSCLLKYPDGSQMVNVHGHIHQNPSPTKNHRCVCVEWTDYKPIHVDNVIQLNNYKTRTKNV